MRVNGGSFSPPTMRNARYASRRTVSSETGVGKNMKQSTFFPYPSTPFAIFIAKRKTADGGLLFAVEMAGVEPASNAVGRRDLRA